jgi:hypothetical protein
MGCRISNVLIGLRRLAVAGSLIVAFAAVSGGTLMAESEASASDKGLAGTWLVEVTLRDCVTGNPLGPAFQSLVTNHRGGTLTEATGSLAFAVGQRSAGHGVWSHQHKKTYTQQIVALILFDTAPNVPFTPGFFAGWQTITHTVEVNGDHSTSAGTNAFYKFDGTLYRTGCSTAAGQRFQ